MTAKAFNRGMTLIEVLVALALLALLSIGIFSSFRFAQRSYAQTRRIAASTEDVLVAQRFVRRVIESAYPFQPGTVPPIHYGLEGNGEALELSAPGAASASASGLYRYRIYVERQGARRDLAVDWYIDRNGVAPSASDASRAVSHEILLKNIESAQWTFAATSAEAGGKGSLQWKSTWSGQPHLPILVKLQVKFPASDRRIWTDLVVAPVVTDDAQCQFDVVAQACRDHLG